MTPNSYWAVESSGAREAIELVAEAAAHPGEIQAEARFALVLLYNRERQYARARSVLDQLRRTFPRNRLVWLETASTWLRDDRPAMAGLALAQGFSALQGDGRKRMFGEDAVWHLKRGTARAVQMGNICGHYAVQSQGTQVYSYTQEQFRSILEQNFG